MKTATWVFQNVTRAVPARKRVDIGAAHAAPIAGSDEQEVRLANPVTAADEGPLRSSLCPPSRRSHPYLDVGVPAVTLEGHRGRTRSEIDLTTSFVASNS